jgi:predicted membrane protein
MSDLLFWLYFCNAVLLIVHEIDSAYWKEWDLFRLPGGINGFLVLHIPMLAVILYGMIAVRQNSPPGLIFSLILSLGVIFAFAIHTYFLRKGRPEFNALMSISILVATLVVSVIQFVVTVKLQIGGLP